MRTLIENGILVTPTEPMADAWLLVDGPKIESLGTGPAPQAERRIDARGRYVAPGFIDLHAQGFRGHDLWDPADDRFLKATRQMAATGTTACQASVDPTAYVCRTMRPRIGRSDGGTRVLGLYFESPFISPKKPGAIPVDRVRPPSPALAREVLDAARDIVSMITLAPEQPGAMAILPLLLAARGPRRPVVVAIGHTSADYTQAMAAIDAGASHCTHLFNCMAPMLHRDPGPVGALLTRPETTVEVVTDGIHLHPAAVRVAVACKGVARTCVITDCVSGNAHPVVDGVPRRADGTIAGSILSMDRAVANARQFARVSLAEAVEMASLTPARVIGWDREKGSLAPGKDADVLIFDEQINVKLTMIGGEVAWET